MPIPDLIPIAYEEGYRTDKVGRYNGGQFFASAWDRHAYMHLFDRDGTYRESKIIPIPAGAALGTTLDGLVSKLPGMVKCDITVRLFQIESDGVLFGLLDESGDRTGDDVHTDWVELYPDGLGFTAPWDGFYST
ncbi:hypothetical protein [Actinoplanes sp. CA-252034]|uniref:hypothetical protein n=1 Tax=Actinoplanes sp. CA-252034 TaxID=3239906 RepID=UPI003D999386